MVHPLLPFSLRGVVWYQGEANTNRAEQYDALLPAMIATWREAFGQGDLPFLVVQLPNFMPATDDPNKPSGWARLRESQRLAASSTPNVGLAVTIDLGDPNDLHPRNKQDVGKRLTQLALGTVYRVTDIVARGPVVAKAVFAGDTVMLTLDAGGTDVRVKGDLKQSFAVAGADGTWHWADASLTGSTVTVRSADVKEVKALRYAWADNPKAAVVNDQGIPASPFEIRKP
ncbi:MAG: sialate O-acetylesterase [Tepidisphaeraceae bacterium]